MFKVTIKPGLGLMPLIPAPRKLRQRIEFEAMLGYIVRLCLK